MLIERIHYFYLEVKYASFGDGLAVVQNNILEASNHLGSLRIFSNFEYFYSFISLIFFKMNEMGKNLIFYLIFFATQGYFQLFLIGLNSSNSLWRILCCQWFSLIVILLQLQFQPINLIIFCMYLVLCTLQ